MENLLSSVLDALAHPIVCYIGLAFDSTVSIASGWLQISLHVLSICIVHV